MMNIEEICKKYTRKEFLDGIKTEETGMMIEFLGKKARTIVDHCPIQYGLKETCGLTANCKNCWKIAVKDLVFKDEFMCTKCGKISKIEVGYKMKKGGIAVHCDTTRIDNNFIEECLKHGIKDAKTYFGTYGGQTCYTICNTFTEGEELNFCSKRWYIDNNYKIIEWEIKGEKEMKEYSLGEVLEMEEGTEFKIVCSNGVNINANCKVCKSPNTKYLVWSSTNKELPITDLLYNATFTKVEKEVPVVEAMKAFRTGKNIICKFKSAADGRNLVEIFIPEKCEDRYCSKPSDNITPYMIVEGKWFI